MVPRIWSLPSRGSLISSPALLTRDPTLQGPDTSQILGNVPNPPDSFRSPSLDGLCVCVCIFLATPMRLWDLSFPTRNWTQVRTVKAPSPNHWTTRNSQDLQVFVKQYTLFIVHHSACPPGKCQFILQVQSKNNCLLGDFWVLQPSKSILGGLRNCLIQVHSILNKLPYQGGIRGHFPCILPVLFLLLLHYH